MTKQSLRNEIALLKNKYSDKDLYDLSAQVFKRLTQTREFKSAKCILAYYSFTGEVFTHDFIEEYVNAKKIILPVVSKGILVLKEYTGKETLRESKYGIMEPTGKEFTDYSQIDLGIIPGVAFDKKLNRLGRGKAYYDRLLTRLTDTYLIGVSFSFQIKERIDVESHDHPMHCIITENETYC